jgi:hypothetical protein
MGKPSDHIVEGSLCVVCNKVPATVLTRLVARDDGMPADGLFWAGGTCWDCVRELAITLNGKVPTTPDPRNLPQLDIEDARTFEEKLRDGDVFLEPDEVYCEVCTWPKRFCVCAGTKRGRKS